MKSIKLASVSGLALLMVLAGYGRQAMQSPVDAACCYFAAKEKDINQPGQKAFITWNPAQKSEAFTVQPKFEGNASDFGMVIPTPSRPKLDEMPRDFFKDLAIYTILMPLPEPIYTATDMPMMPCSAAPGGMGGMVLQEGAVQRKSVRVLEAGVVGSLDYKIIVADDASGLFEWLKQNRYSYSGDESTLQFYIKKKWFFTVMKIDPKQMKKASGGSYSGEVTPTRFSFSSNECIYPLKITQLSVKDKTDALFYVQAPQQMDLAGDWSWMPSYRSMYLTYMLGCSADQQQQKELQARTQWLESKHQKDNQFETTKLEWAKKLTPNELSVLEDPLKKYGQMGTGGLPPGAKVISLADFLQQMKADALKSNKQKMPEYAKQDLIRMEDQYQPTKGMIVKNDPKSVGKSYISTRFTWYPAREAPQDDVKGLTRLKGHLRDGQWLTKFRKTIRKDEMKQDMVLAVTPAGQEQTYVRIMPTSPP
ncbi:MAG: DUF2330 domain-containing protein [Xanthomonadales bacterium]|nr:DUF2330 domain-containing protein [Xanthomonadales bacterium]